MTTTGDSGKAGAGSVKSGSVDMKLEVLVLPVSDVDRAGSFYKKLGWRVDAEVNANGVRLLQLTPPGSGCSIQFGTNLTPAAPGSARNVYLVVDDMEAARADLAGRGVAVSDAFHEASLGGRFEEPGGGRSASKGHHRNRTATAPLPRSAIRTETPGCCRR